MFPPPDILTTEVFARLPESLQLMDRPSQWLADRHVKMHSFLEGPSFDREGNLWCVDLAHGRLLRVGPGGGDFEVALEYDGEPNGLKIHQDGRIFVADHRHGVMVHTPGTNTIQTVLGNARREGLKGLNDIVFASNGDLYMTDQGESALEDPTGRVYRLRADGKTVDLLMSGLAGPNGLVLDEARKILYVAITRENAIFSLPIEPNYGGMKKAGRFLQLNGATGPDGLALDEAGNLVVVHAGAGTAWVFSRIGEPLYRIRSCAGIRTTNCAYGGDDRRTLYITESEQGVVLRVRLPVPGRAMYSHS